MKKIFKSFMALMSVVLLMASCDNASPVKSDYDPVFDESQKGYTFAASSQGATYGVGYEDSIYSVLVFRNYTEGEETVALQFGGDAQYFELPESVTFQDGQDVTSFDINVQGNATEEIEWSNNTGNYVDTTKVAYNGSAHFEFNFRASDTPKPKKEK
jgi:hypothetical protein